MRSVWPAVLQCGIDAFRTYRPSFLGFGLLVPVGSRNGFALVLTLFRVIDFDIDKRRKLQCAWLRAVYAVLLFFLHPAAYVSNR